MNINHPLKNIRKKVSGYLGKPVVFVRRRGSSETEYKGTLTEVYDNHAIISLDEDLYKIQSYSFSYTNILLNEGYLQEWNKKIDSELILKQLNKE